MRWTWLGLGIGVVCIGVACIAGMHFGASGLASPPRSYREAVMQVLDQPDILDVDIQAIDTCPTLPQCWELGSDVDSAYAVEIVMGGAQPQYGQITCREYRAGCVLTLVGRNMYSVPLSPLAQDPLWLEALQRPIQALEGWLRTWRAQWQHP